jgi:hypothetical protein
MVEHGAYVTNAFGEAIRFSMNCNALERQLPYILGYKNLDSMNEAIDSRRSIFAKMLATESKPQGSADSAGSEQSRSKAVGGVQK